MRKLFLLSLFIIGVHSIYAQSYTERRQKYIDNYKNIAIEEMKRSGIPASITLAQGMLESDNGNSTLARKSNNHFGIKCHGWKGKKVYYNDDAPNECFRSYNSPLDSYKDHTDYLMATPRYTFLFSYSSTDYKSWAKGLKKAGYATSPTYSTRLIKIIEDNNLHQFDIDGISNARFITDKKENKKTGKTAPGNDEFTVKLVQREILNNNRIDFIRVKEGDTFEKLAKELDLLNWELYKYNDLSKDAQLEDGQILYLQPKRNKAEPGKETHEVKDGETMYSISQAYGVKLKKLYRKNLMKPGNEPNEGDIIYLRKNKK